MTQPNSNREQEPFVREVNQQAALVARVYLECGAFHEAERHARAALSDSGTRATGPLVILAESLWRLGKFHEASTVRSQIPNDFDPAYEADVRLLDVILLIEAGRYQDCIAQFGHHARTDANSIADVRTQMNIAQCQARLNNLSQARDGFEWAFAQAEKLHWKEGTARAQLQIALVERSGGDWRKAIQLLLQAKQTFARIGSFRDYVLSVLNLGLQRLWLGDLSQAADDLKEATGLSSQMAEHRYETSARITLGLAFVRLGRHESARAELARGARLCRQQSSPRRLAIALEHIGELHIVEQNWTRAATCLARALSIAQRIAPEGDIIPEVLRRQAEVALGTGRLHEALAIAQDAASRAAKSGDRYEHATALRVIGQSLLALGRETEAQENFRTALATLEELGETFERERIIALLESRTVAAPPGKPVKRIIHIDSPQSREIRRLLAAHGMIGSSRPLQDMMRQVALIAPNQLPVLIQGETGVGKELVARAIHTIGAGEGRPLVAFNCATCPADLLDAELFGHARGAFTGANVARAGLVRSAEGGSLFLDEIGELREESQARLLRLLDSGEIRPLGSDQSVRVEVRIIAATHVDLRQRIESRRFRPDLYFRLAGICILVPPLRERPGDVHELVDHFTGEARASVRPGFAGFSPTAIRRMEAYSWPGNVRQLKMEVLRLAAMASDGSVIETWDPPDGERIETDRLEAEEAMLILQDRDRLQALVRDLNGQMNDVARHLGVSRGHLYRVFKKSGIRARDFRTQ